MAFAGNPWFYPPQHSRWRDEGKGKGKDIYIADRKDRGQPTAMSFVNRGHGKGKGTGKGNANYNYNAWFHDLYVNHPQAYASAYLQRSSAYMGDVRRQRSGAFGSHLPSV